MALVHMKNRRLDAESAQQSHAPNAQQNLLHDSSCAVTAVNPQGKVAEMLLVFRPIGVEQINGGSADIDAPGLERNLIHPKFHLANQRLTFLVQDRFYWKIPGV